MRRPLIATLALAATLLLAGSAAATTISNGTVSLGVNPSGDLNDGATQVGVQYDPTGNDGTFPGCPCEGWGAGAGGPTPFEGRANEDLGGETGLSDVSFVTSATAAVATVDVLRGETPALRVRQDYHPSPTTPNLYEITVTLENISPGALTDVRYERDMDWDIEPTPANEFVTLNRGARVPSTLIYSDDNGFGDTFPFSSRDVGTENGPLDPSTVNANYVDKGPDDHGARFTFSFGDLAAGEQKQFFLYYGAAGTEPDADAAVSAAALELFSYGQPNVADGADADALADGPAQGKPNTFIWGFRGVGGNPVIPPTLTLAPKSATNPAGGRHALTATLLASGGDPVPGARVVFAVAGANPARTWTATDTTGHARFAYTGSNAGDDTITACLDSNSDGACQPGEVADTATVRWEGGSPTPPPVIDPVPTPQPVLGQTVVGGLVAGTVRVKGKDGRFHVLGANETIPLGSTVDATKGKVRITSAAGTGGVTQSGVFYQGAFVITQTKGAKPITQLALAGAISCKPKGKASSSARRKRVRRLWGDGKGRFRTRGRHGAATVRGTKWLTEDRCDGTLIRVSRGVVSVRDFTRKKTVTVKKGHQYLARAKKAKRKR